MSSLDSTSNEWHLFRLYMKCQIRNTIRYVRRQIGFGYYGHPWSIVIYITVAVKAIDQLLVLYKDMVGAT